MNTEELRTEWQEKVTWSDAVFESLERFVDARPKENKEKFVESGDLRDLFGDSQYPDPLPSNRHQEYMADYAELSLSED